MQHLKNIRSFTEQQQLIAYYLQQHHNFKFYEYARFIGHLNSLIKRKKTDPKIFNLVLQALQRFVELTGHKQYQVGAKTCIEIFYYTAEIFSKIADPKQIIALQHLLIPWYDLVSIELQYPDSRILPKHLTTYCIYSLNKLGITKAQLPKQFERSILQAIATIMPMANAYDLSIGLLYALGQMGYTIRTLPEWFMPAWFNAFAIKLKHANAQDLTAGCLHALRDLQSTQADLPAWFIAAWCNAMQPQLVNINARCLTMLLYDLTQLGYSYADLPESFIQQWLSLVQARFTQLNCYDLTTGCIYSIYLLGLSSHHLPANFISDWEIAMQAKFADANILDLTMGCIYPLTKIGISQISENFIFNWVNALEPQLDQITNKHLITGCLYPLALLQFYKFPSKFLDKMQNILQARLASILYDQKDNDALLRTLYYYKICHNLNFLTQTDFNLLLAANSHLEAEHRILASSAMEAKVFAKLQNILQNPDQLKAQFFITALVGPVDFAIPQDMVIIQVDGRTHFDSKQSKQYCLKDLMQNKIAQSLGWSVIRLPIFQLAYYHDDKLQYFDQYLRDKFIACGKADLLKSVMHYLPYYSKTADSALSITKPLCAGTEISATSRSSNNTKRKQFEYSKQSDKRYRSKGSL